MADETKKEPEKKPVAKVAIKTPDFSGLKDLRELGQKIKPWELAGLMHFSNWKPGKMVSEKEFDEKLALFRKRPQGGGRIKK